MLRSMMLGGRSSEGMRLPMACMWEWSTAWALRREISAAIRLRGMGWNSGEARSFAIRLGESSQRDHTIKKKSWLGK